VNVSNISDKPQRAAQKWYFEGHDALDPARVGCRLQPSNGYLAPVTVAHYRNRSGWSSRR